MGTSQPVLMPSRVARVGTIDERFQSYNVEMLEVTGGKAWKPYGPELDAYGSAPVLLVINNDVEHPCTLAQGGTRMLRYTPSAADRLHSMRVRLNGEELSLGKDATLPRLRGQASSTSEQTFAPATITFLVIPEARNDSCR